MEYHCELCRCPKEIWNKVLKTYQGDECELYDSFSSLIEDGMTAEKLTQLALTELPKEFPHLLNPEETIEEMVEITIECGVIEKLKKAQRLFDVQGG